jgi:hypothetical protein
MHADILKHAAVEFLRYEKGCKLVCLERSPFRQDPCTPDVIGVNASRRAVEIEVKRTWQDFKNNRQKDSMFRRKFLGLSPAQYYFIVPPALVAKVREALEPGEGLLTVDGLNGYSGLPKARVVVPATFTKTRPLTLKEIVRMVAHQTGSLSSALSKIARTKVDSGEVKSDYEI